MGGPVPSAGPVTGRVTSFDRTRGLGEVRTDDGAAYGFHATAIADGSRTVEVGAVVTVSIAPGHRGLYEAASVAVVAGAAPKD